MRPDKRPTLARDLSLEADQRSAVIDFLRRLVQTRSPSSQEGALADLIQAELTKLGVPGSSRDRLGNVVARLGNGQGPTLVYNAHMDTVDATDADWPYDPFAAQIEDGVLYGLGTCDTKGALAAMTYAAGRLAQAGIPLQGQLVLAFVVQEETCEGLAMRALCSEGDLQPDWVVLGDPTGMQISRGQRGRVLLKVTVHGQPSHAARPDLGQNAINAAARLIFGVDLLSAEMVTDPILGPGSIAVTHIESQEASLHAIPGRCTFYVDRRLTLGETVNMALAEVERVIATERVSAEVEIVERSATSYTGVTSQVHQAFNAWALEVDDPLVAAVRHIVRQTLGGEPGLLHWPFSTAGVYTMGEAGIPTVGFGPGNPDHAHTVNDQVRVDDVVNAAHVYGALAAHLLGA